jgi:alpha-tubulin suppressor-like RCC1 family protein
MTCNNLARWTGISVVLIVNFGSVSIEAQSLTAGGRHALTICEVGVVFGWGDGGYGQLGNGGFGIYWEPNQVDNLEGIISVSASGEHSLALDSDGSVWAFGKNDTGQLGTGDLINSNQPIEIQNFSGIVKIAAGGAGFGWDHSLAIKDDNTVWAWGANAFGQLGNGTTTDSNTPVQVSGLSGIVSIAAGNGFSLGLKDDGSIWGWGNGLLGPLGTGGSGNSANSSPIPIEGLGEVIGMSAGSSHTLILTNEGTVYGLGYNAYGQIGDSIDVNSSAIPFQVTGLSDIIQVACGSFHSVALRDDGTVWSWGNNEYGGQLGNGSVVNTHIPVQALGLTDVVYIDAGNYFSMALKSDGTIWGWGFNSTGQIGNGFPIDSDVPIQSIGCDDPVESGDIEDNEVWTTHYPNPFHEILTIEISADSHFEDLIIRDLLGKIILKTNLNSQERFTWDARLVPAGIYVVALLGARESEFIKVVKQ